MANKTTKRPENLVEPLRPSPRSTFRPSAPLTGRDMTQSGQSLLPVDEGESLGRPIGPC